MPQSEDILVLVTRPKESADRFVAELARQAGPHRSIVSPAFENESTNAVIPNFDTAIFTSRAGVMFAPVGEDRKAYCVGDATAAAAQQAGYVALSATGDASDLVALILEQKPEGRLLHLRGEVSHGNVSALLKDAEIECSEIVTYRKSPIPPNEAVVVALNTTSKVIVPLFSAETVSILASWGCDFSNAQVVAISDAVAQEAARLHPALVVTADRPDQASMVVQTAALIA